MKRRFSLFLTNTLLLLFLSVKVFAAEFTTSDLSKAMDTTDHTQKYTQLQEEMSATINSVSDIPDVLEKAFTMHATTVRITSDTNIFSDLANELNTEIGGMIGRYHVHNCNGYHINRKGNSYIITLSWLSTIKEEQELDAYIQQTIESYQEGSVYQQIRKVHDTICDTVVYDNATAEGKADNASAYDAVVNKRSVCTGYALLFQKYMDALGIPSFTATGTRNGGPHMWNIVNIDGQWYHIDCTWDDQGDNISDQWFLCGADRAGYSSWGNVTLAKTSYANE